MDTNGTYRIILNRSEFPQSYSDKRDYVQKLSEILEEKFNDAFNVNRQFVNVGDYWYYPLFNFDGSESDRLYFCLYYEVYNGTYTFYFRYALKNSNDNYYRFIHFIGKIIPFSQYYGYTSNVIGQSIPALKDGFCFMFIGVPSGYITGVYHVNATNVSQEKLDEILHKGMISNGILCLRCIDRNDNEYTGIIQETNTGAMTFILTNTGYETYRISPQYTAVDTEVSAIRNKFKYIFDAYFYYIKNASVSATSDLQKKVYIERNEDINSPIINILNYNNTKYCSTVRYGAISSYDNMMVLLKGEYNPEKEPERWNKKTNAFSITNPNIFLSTGNELHILEYNVSGNSFFYNHYMYNGNWNVLPQLPNNMGQASANAGHPIFTATIYQGTIYYLYSVTMYLSGVSVLMSLGRLENSEHKFVTFFNKSTSGIGGQALFTYGDTLYVLNPTSRNGTYQTYIYDGDKTFTLVTTYKFSEATNLKSIVEHNGYIYLANDTAIYKFNGSEWTFVVNNPHVQDPYSENGVKILSYNGVLHVFYGKQNSETMQPHYILNGDTLVSVENDGDVTGLTQNHNHYQVCIEEYDGLLTMLGDDKCLWQLENG